MGLEIGAVCPSCKAGRLQPVYELPNLLAPATVLHGPVGNKPGRLPRIERLSCTHCCVSTEAKDRGKTIVQALGPKTEGFTNPPQEPEKCGCHKADLSVGGYVPQGLRQGLEIDPDDPERTVAAIYARRFTFCAISGVLHWVVPALLENKV